MRLPGNVRAHAEARPASLHQSFIERESNMGTATQRLQQSTGQLCMSTLAHRRDVLRELCKAAPIGQRGKHYIIRTLDMRYIGEGGAFVSVEDALRMERMDAIELAATIRTEHGPAYAIHYTDALLACYDAIEDAIAMAIISERERAQQPQSTVESS
jgi:hypothetical protein